MMAVSVSSKMIREMNPMLLFVSLGSLFVTYLIFSTKSGSIAQLCATCPLIMDEQTRGIYIIMAVAIVALAFLNREKRLLTKEECIDIMMSDAMMMQNTGRLREDGRILPLEDWRLRRIQGKPEVSYVACGIEGESPVVIVYGLDPYNGYIISTSKREYWDSTKDPDLKIIVPPTWIDFLKQRQDFGLSGDVDVL